MTDNLKKFLEYASKNEDMAQKMKALSDEADKDTVIRRAIEIAKDTGFTLSTEDFEENATGELSEDELASVAGGNECICVGGGAGAASGDGSINDTCGCVVAGAGTYYEYEFHGNPYVYCTNYADCDQKESIRCACVLGGYGEDH